MPHFVRHFYYLFMNNLAENLLSITGKADINLIAANAIKDKKLLEQLMNFFTNNEDVKDKLPQRAAWVLSHVAEENIEALKPYTKIIVEQLNKENVHNSITRNAVRILQDLEIPEAFHGDVMNTCFQLIEKPSTPAAIKAFSLTTLFNLTKYYPEIKPELKLIIKELWDNETPAFKSRGRQILAALGKKTS